MEFKITQEWLDKFKSKYHNTQEDYKPVYQFAVDKGQYLQLVEWCEEHDEICPYGDPANCGAIGGRLMYSFTSTSIGQVCKVSCACGCEVDLTEYGDW